MNILDSFLVHFSMHNRMWHMQMTVLELRNLNGYSYILVVSCPQMVACAGITARSVILYAMAEDGTWGKLSEAIRDVGDHQKKSAFLCVPTSA